MAYVGGARCVDNGHVDVPLLHLQRAMEKQG
jgi:hypothetical protein